MRAPADETQKGAMPFVLYLHVTPKVASCLSTGRKAGKVQEQVTCACIYMYSKVLLLRVRYTVNNNILINKKPGD